MNSIAAWGLAISAGIIATIYPQEIKAEGFTGADFSTWEIASQDSYIQTSITMAGMVLTRTKPEAATCINDWYFAQGQSEARNSFVRKTIASYQDFHPSGVILAIIAEECGALK